jgi:hypothetical protein
MKKVFALIIVLFLIVRVEAQPGRSRQEDNFLHIGFKAGAGYSTITDLSKVLVSESYYTGYTFENSGVWSFTGGVYLNYKFEGSISAIYFELSYSTLGNKLLYSDIHDFNYEFLVKYNFINMDLWYKAYLLDGLHLGLGPRLGLNLTPGGLFYSSNGEAQFGPDILIQQQMRDVLKGRTNFSIGLGAGYEFPFGLSLDVRYYQGLSDIMETEVNSFRFIENRNTGSVVQISLGFAIPYDLNVF